jgi:hypothetical protein
MVMDHYKDKWTDNDWIKPTFPTVPYPTSPGTGITGFPPAVINPAATKEDIDALKKDLEELKSLVKRALKYDEENGEPECETEAKVAIIKSVADALGVEIEGLK